MSAHIGTIRCVAAVLAAALTACAAPLEEPGRFQEGATGTEEDACAGVDVEVDILAADCGGASCHGEGGPAADLDLVTPGVAARLAGTASTSGACGETLLIAPGDPDASLLYTKLAAEPPCGSPMPLGGEPLDEGAVACVRDWIAGLP